MKKILLFKLLFTISFSIEYDDGFVRFIYQDIDAQSVYLVGSMNEWNTSSDLMKKQADGTWEIRLKLDSGKYSYKYLVDGNWKNDPYNPNLEDDGYGGSNSFFELKDGKLTTAEKKNFEVKSIYNPKIYFKGRYYSKNIFNKDASERFMLNKPSHDLNFGIEVKFNPNFIGYTILSINNNEQNQEMWKTNFNYERSFLKLNADYFDLIAFDNYGLVRFNEPLPTIGGIGFNEYDYGYDYAGIYVKSSKLVSDMIFNYVPVNVKVELILSDKIGFSDDDITASRFEISKSITKNDIVSIGNSKYQYKINPSFGLVQKHNTNSVDVHFTKIYSQNHWQDPMIFNFIAQYSKYINQDEDSVVTTWMEGDNLFGQFDVKFPRALKLFFNYQKSFFELDKKFSRNRYTFGSNFKLANFEWNFNAQIWENDLSDSLNWSNYFRFVEKTDCNGRWFQEHTELFFNKYTLLGYSQGAFFESSLEYNFKLNNNNFHTRLENTFAHQELFTKAKYIENILLLKYNISSKWIIKSNTRIPYYNDKFLDLKTNFSKNDDVFISTYYELMYFLSESIWLSLGYGINPYVLNTVTDKFYFRGRQEFLNDFSDLNDHLESYYGGIGEKIRQSENALMNTKQILLQAKIKF
ncbi:MAG: hypothetical protein CMF80_06130 [Candidatus Marinimicrobia bacterium]|nr:hypothetical protein [Candidatus Neomarinimicrobiota bacterium]